MRRNMIRTISTGILLIGLGVLFYTNFWWPGILIVLWVSIGVREYLSKRYYDLFVSTIILLGLFVMYYLNVNWNILLPILFVLGGIYIICREFFYSKRSRIEEKIAELQAELDEEKEAEKK